MSDMMAGNQAGRLSSLLTMVLVFVVSCTGVTTGEDTTTTVTPTTTEPATTVTPTTTEPATTVTPTTTEPATTEATEGTSDGQEESVLMQNVAFRPDEITVEAGTTVVWTNQDLVTHTTTSDDDAWDSSSMGQGDSFSFTFEEAGTYTYICRIHPAQMRGTVIVEG